MAPRQPRDRFCPFGGSARQDVPAAADVEAISEDDDDFAAWAAHRKGAARHLMAAMGVRVLGTDVTGVAVNTILPRGAR